MVPAEPVADVKAAKEISRPVFFMAAWTVSNTCPNARPVTS